MKIYNSFTDTEFNEILKSKNPKTEFVKKHVEKLERKLKAIKLQIKFLAQYLP